MVAMKSSRISIATLLIALLGASICISAASAGTKPEVRRYIVVLKDSVDHPAALARSQAKNRDARLDHIYTAAINGYAAAMTPGQARALERDPKVKYVESDHPVEGFSQEIPLGIERIGTLEYPGTDIDGEDDERIDADVAIIDSGVDPEQEDLDVVGLTECLSSIPCADGEGPDELGHGTHVAGTVAAIDNDKGVVGVAPGARIWSVRVLNAFNEGAVSNVIAGVDWVTQHASTIEAANMSLGCACESEAWEEATAAAVDAGVVFAVSAGNSNIDVGGTATTPPIIPAKFDDVITVSALADYDGTAGGLAPEGGCGGGANPGPDDTLASFSNWGAKVDVSAPGVCVVSSLPGNKYKALSGTSMASPHVAGAAAVILERSPSLTPAQVAAQIVADATIGAVDVDDKPGSPNRLLYVPDVAVPTFVSVVPARLLETRPGLSTVDGQFLGQGVVPASGIVELAVGGRAGVPANASAAVLNVTVVEPAAAGFVTVFPCGSGVPNSSSVNFVAHATVANAVVSKLGTQGRVCLFTNSATHLVVDVNGYFPAGSSFVSVLPARVLETRPGLPTVDGLFAGQGVVPSGDVVELTVAGRAGVGGDASAVVLNVTVVGPASAGYVNVFPCGTGVPNSSSVNFAAGATVANAVVSKVGVGGQVCVFTNVAADLIVDVNGYFPAGSSFTSVLPARLLETRPGLSTVDGLSAGQGLVPAGGIVQLPVVNRGGVAANASAVVLNVTVVEPAAAGFVTVFPCGNSVPNSSSVNFAAGATVANAVVSQVGAGGLVCLYTNVAAHLLTDVNGYFVA